MKKVESLKKICFTHGKPKFTLQVSCFQLEESFEDSQLLSSDDYIYDEWLLIKNNKIFENFHWKMWISPDCQPDSKELTWMVEKCGGKVRAILYTSILYFSVLFQITRHLHKADLAIAPETWQVPEIHVCLEAVTPLFLIDSISMAALQSYKDYYLEN